MDELLYSDSEISELLTHEHDPDANASCGPCIEVVDDLTGEIDDLDSGRGPLTPLTSNGDILVVNPRSYQLEMLEESLKRNIIVAVCVHALYLATPRLTSERWILALVKPTCKRENNCISRLSPR
jgi:hypothetical protein